MSIFLTKNEVNLDQNFTVRNFNEDYIITVIVN